MRSNNRISWIFFSYCASLTKWATLKSFATGLILIGWFKKQWKWAESWQEVQQGLPGSTSKECGVVIPAFLSFEFHSVNKTTPMNKGVKIPSNSKKSFVTGNTEMTYKGPDHLLIQKLGTSSTDPLASLHVTPIKWLPCQLHVVSDHNFGISFRTLHCHSFDLNCFSRRTKTLVMELMI